MVEAWMIEVYHLSTAKHHKTRGAEIKTNLSREYFDPHRQEPGEAGSWGRREKTSP